MFVRYSLLAFLAVMLGSCVKRQVDADDPRERIREYVSVSFGVKSVSDRAKLEAQLAGDARLRLASWSNEQFSKAFVETKRAFEKLVFVELKRNGDSDAVVTYELSYVDKKDGTEARVTQKKLAHLVKKEGVWKIDGVKNIKELFEYANGLDVSFP